MKRKLLGESALPMSAAVADPVGATRTEHGDDLDNAAAAAEPPDAAFDAPFDADVGF